MIRNSTQHSANERTFLAWIRTGIAVITFGFVIEKFNLFILAAVKTTDVSRTVRVDLLTGPIGRYEGMGFMLVGIMLIVLGYLRFSRTERLVDAPELEQIGDVNVEIIVTVVLVGLVALYCLSILIR